MNGLWARMKENEKVKSSRNRKEREASTSKSKIVSSKPIPTREIDKSGGAVIVTIVFNP